MADPGRIFAWAALLVGGTVIIVSGFTTKQIRDIAAKPVHIEPPPPPLPPPPKVAPEEPDYVEKMRPLDRYVVRSIEAPQLEAVRENIAPDEPFRVDLLGEGGRLSAARIDLDRDGHWDERWTLTVPGSQALRIVREVSSQDNDTYDERFRWFRKGWIVDSDEPPR